MTRAKRFICEGCRRYDQATGSLCKHCQTDYDLLYAYYTRFIQRVPAASGLTMSQVFLQLAKRYFENR